MRLIDSSPHSISVCDIALEDMDLITDRFDVLEGDPGPVESPHLMPIGDEPLRKVRSGETGDARDKNRRHASGSLLTEKGLRISQRRVGGRQGEPANRPELKLEELVERETHDEV